MEAVSCREQFKGRAKLQIELGRSNWLATELNPQVVSLDPAATASRA